MSIFSFFPFFACAMCAILSVIVYFLNRKALINTLFASAALFGAYWAFTEAMMWQAGNAETAFLWGKAAFLWPFFTIFGAHFAFVFTESKLAKSKYIFLFLYLPAVVFSLINLTTNQLYGLVVKEYWGYVVTYSDSWFTLLTAFWSGGLSIFAAFLCIRYYYKAKDKIKKLQAQCVAIGLSIPVFAYAITNITFPLLKIDIPNVGNISTGGLIGLVAYAIWRYELFSLNPAMAAENILSTMPDSLVLADLRGQILKVNKAIISFLKYSEAELIGKSVSELFQDEKYGSNVLDELVDEREIISLETKFKTKSGEEKTVTFSGSIVRSNRGQDIGITCIIHDITHRKLMEEKLVMAERFASIGQLAGMVGHDLRNPLTSIRGATYYLKNKYSDKMDSTDKEMFRTIEASIDYSDKIISDLLDYSKKIKLEKEVATPKILMSNVFSILRPPQNIVVRDLTKDYPEIKIDLNKMTRVLANIVKNAFDAMPNGGTLTVTSKKTKGNLELSFCDTGEGMSQDTLSKLWVPLFTTKAKGMGFGLSICKRIVEAHGGKIIAESIVGRGTEMTVVIPH